MKDPAEDRRMQRTRKLLNQAMFSLMQEKRYDKITVQDIIDRANVGRSTFYAHFQDKEDLAVSGLIDMLETMTHVLQSEDQHGAPIIPIAALFRHAQENYPMFKGITHDRGWEIFFERGQSYWTQSIEEHIRAQIPAGKEAAISVTVVATFVSGSLISLLKWWLDNKMPYSPERMEEIAMQLILPGVRGVLEI